jgi:hypothetical protein
MLVFQEDLTKDNECEADGCAKHPSFGLPGERPRRCKAHMLDGMVRMLARGLVTPCLRLLTNPVHVLGDARRYKVRGRRLRKAAFLRLSGRAAATVQGAHAGRHGAHAGPGHIYTNLWL